MEAPEVKIKTSILQTLFELGARGWSVGLSVQTSSKCFKLNFSHTISSLELQRQNNRWKSCLKILKYGQPMTAITNVQYLTHSIFMSYEWIFIKQQNSKLQAKILYINLPHITPLITWERHQNFEDPMFTSWYLEKTNDHLLVFYSFTLSAMVDSFPIHPSAIKKIYMSSSYLFSTFNQLHLNYTLEAPSVLQWFCKRVNVHEKLLHHPKSYSKKWIMFYQTQSNNPSLFPSLFLPNILRA
jgi:hypothetical protein